VLTPDGELREQALHDGHVYHSPTVFQLKAMLYHAGILTERGTEPDNQTKFGYQLLTRLVAAHAVTRGFAQPHYGP